jgi:hypothetical protein
VRSSEKSAQAAEAGETACSTIDSQKLARVAPAVFDF